ncbi:DnaJ domain-containing protein [Dichomitus squalens]|uniref:DnaJ domain-containing protein n=1 Tax=Dichomitus squalens TaxID=114155 RepID=A0A4V2K9R9_9APHY|nr:DnaJ domain-containing protein [Dichomitus squalens]
MSTFPDYYKLLNISQNASVDDIKTAYKKESLKTHPDRLANATPEQRQAATEKFQAVADAYYVLSDPTRRREYDSLYSTRRPQERTAQPDASASFFATFANMFGKAAGSGTGAGATGAAPGDRPDADHVFADVFDDLLRPEVERHAPWWAWLGAVCGAGIGFIIANIPGLLFGAYAGNKLGAIRDAKGKSIAAVFTQLGGDQKAQVRHTICVALVSFTLLA